MEQWNIKMNCTNFLHDVCSMNDYDKYSMHHEFSFSVTALDELQVHQISASISRHGNLFDLGSSSIRNLVTCSEVDSKLSAFLLKVNEVGGNAPYNDFRKSRLFEKTPWFYSKDRHLTKNIILSRRNCRCQRNKVLHKKNWLRLIELNPGPIICLRMAISKRQKKKKRLEMHLEKPCLFAHQKFSTQAWL